MTFTYNMFDTKIIKMFMLINVDTPLYTKTDVHIMLTCFQINSMYYCVNRHYSFMLVIYSPIGIGTL